MTKDENIAFNTATKVVEDKGYTFRRINEDVDDGFVEDNWQKPRGTNNLKYHYSESDVQYILKKCAKKQVVATRGVIYLIGNSDEGMRN